jgi:hypothetical protein
VSRGITAENNSSESEASATSISTATAASSLPSSSATTPREHSNLAPQSSPRSSRDNHDHDHDHDHDQAGQQQPEAFDSTLPVEPSDDPALGPNPDNDNANGTSADEGGSALASREHQAHEKNEDVKEVEGDNDENCVEEDHEVTTSIVAVSTGDNDDTSDGAHQQQQLQPDTAGEVDSGPATSATKQNLNILDVTEDDHDEPNQDNEEDKEEEVGDEGEDDIEDEDEDDIEDEVEDEDEDLLSASNSIASMTLLADTALTEIGVVEGEEPLTTTTHSPLPTYEPSLLPWIQTHFTVHSPPGFLYIYLGRWSRPLKLISVLKGKWKNSADAFPRWKNNCDSPSTTTTTTWESIAKVMSLQVKIRMSTRMKKRTRMRIHPYLVPPLSMLSAWPNQIPNQRQHRHHHHHRRLLLPRPLLRRKVMAPSWLLLERILKEVASRKRRKKRRRKERKRNARERKRKP